MSDEISVDLERLKLADQHFLHDLDQFWQRARFFILVQGALFSVFASVAGDDEGHELVPLLVVFGFVVAIYWAAISRLTLDRIRTWRDVVIAMDERLCGDPVVREAERGPEGWRRSPTGMAAALPWAVAAMWLVGALVVLV